MTYKALTKTGMYKHKFIYQALPHNDVFNLDKINIVLNVYSREVLRKNNEIIFSFGLV